MHIAGKRLMSLASTLSNVIRIVPIKGSQVIYERSLTFNGTTTSMSRSYANDGTNVQATFLDIETVGAVGGRNLVAAALCHRQQDARR